MTDMNYKTSDYHGYECREFEIMGRMAKLVCPKVKANGKWALKTEYFDAFPDTELELLKRGWHIAYNENTTRWAEPEDLLRKADFVEFVSKEFALSEKCVPVGMSCGGMYAVKLTAIIPDKIAGLYLDAPVINLLSCPCALGVAKVSLYDEYFKLTGRTISEMLSYRDHPLDKLPILVENNIPIVLVAGDSDIVVPYSENGALVEKYYKEHGGNIKVFIKPGCDHHPHGYENPGVVCDIIESFVN